MRAWIGALVWSSRFFFPIAPDGWAAWRLGVWCVLISEPHAIFLPGFYLSFIAVAILMLVTKRFKVSGFKQTMIIQLGCMIGLMPLTLFWFHYGSLNSFFANMFAIPMIGLVYVPLSLLTLIMAFCSNFLWIGLPVNWIGTVFLWLLEQVNRLHAINLMFALPNIWVVITLMMLLGALLFLPHRGLILLLSTQLAACFIGHKSLPDNNNMMMYVLDVGQGLSVLIKTKTHTLLYDTGGAFPNGSDMGSWVIQPFLQNINIHRLDAVVISHPDLDHRGGYPTLKSAFPIKTLWVDNPDFYHEGLSCHQKKSWLWDGVTFTFFPIYSNELGKNNHSCVLRVSTEKSSVLLTGDIERPAETYLLKHYSGTLSSEVLIVAHHGSQTSSSEDFIRKVHPKYAVFSYGYLNRYRFPHQKTVQLFDNNHIQMIDTVHCGASIWQFFQKNEVNYECNRDKIPAPFDLIESILFNRSSNSA